MAGAFPGFLPAGEPAGAVDCASTAARVTTPRESNKPGPAEDTGLTAPKVLRAQALPPRSLVQTFRATLSKSALFDKGDDKGHDKDLKKRTHRDFERKTKGRASGRPLS
jgi:hypothetical protein